jgi:hypothetical protein
LSPSTSITAQTSSIRTVSDFVVVVADGGIAVVVVVAAAAAAAVVVVVVVVDVVVVSAAAMLFLIAIFLLPRLSPYRHALQPVCAIESARVHALNATHAGVRCRADEAVPDQRPGGAQYGCHQGTG